MAIIKLSSAHFVSHQMVNRTYPFGVRKRWRSETLQTSSLPQPWFFVVGNKNWFCSVCIIKGMWYLAIQAAGRKYIFAHHVLFHSEIKPIGEDSILVLLSILYCSVYFDIWLHACVCVCVCAYMCMSACCCMRHIFNIYLQNYKNVFCFVKPNLTRAQYIKASLSYLETIYDV